MSIPFNNLNLNDSPYKIILALFIILVSCTTKPEECGLGYTEMNGKCYNDEDIDVLQAFSDSNGIVDLFQLSVQKWNENGRLTMLWLYDDTLKGEIPNNIGNLRYLDTLNLAFNQITGEIPESIGDLENLDYLYLYSNQLNGNIPTSICNIFSKASHFWIQYNALCPPYPDCIPESDIYPQNTSQCQ